MNTLIGVIVLVGLFFVVVYWAIKARKQ